MRGTGLPRGQRAGRQPTPLTVSAGEIAAGQPWKLHLVLLSAFPGSLGLVVPRALRWDHQPCVYEGWGAAQPRRMGSGSCNRGLPEHRLSSPPQTRAPRQALFGPHCSPYFFPLVPTFKSRAISERLAPEEHEAGGVPKPVFSQGPGVPVSLTPCSYPTWKPSGSCHRGPPTCAAICPGQATPPPHGIRVAPAGSEFKAPHSVLPAAPSPPCLPWYEEPPPEPPP